MTLAHSLQSTASLLEATRAVNNWRALLLLGATALASVLVFGLLAASDVLLLAVVGGLMVAFYGFNAVGIMLMDACRVGVPAAPGDAIRRALASSLRVLGVALLALAGLLALVGVVALLLLICRIPVLGPLLFAFVLPLSTLVLGLAGMALLCVCLPLAACAVWTGASVSQAASNLLTMVRRRLVPVILQEVVLTLIAVAASFVIGSVLLMGLSITTGLTAGILGTREIEVTPLGLVMGFTGGGYLLAARLSGFVLMAFATLVPGLILIQGFCQIYLDASDTLASDLPATSGDDTLNTAARLRAAGEAAQAHQARREHEAGAAAAGAAPAAPGGPPARIEPAGLDEAPATPGAPEAFEVSAPREAADVSAPPVADAAPQAGAGEPAPASPGQQSLGFADDPAAAPPASPASRSDPRPGAGEAGDEGERGAGAGRAPQR